MAPGIQSGGIPRRIFLRKSVGKWKKMLKNKRKKGTARASRIMRASKEVF